MKEEQSFQQSVQEDLENRSHRHARIRNLPESVRDLPQYLLELCEPLLLDMCEEEYGVDSFLSASPKLLSSVLLLLLAAGPLWVTSAPLVLDSSGEDMDDSSPSSSPIQLHADSVVLARLIYNEARKLHGEVCRESSVCEDSMEILVHTQLYLPKMIPEDRCFSNSKKYPFHKEKCLQTISKYLKAFQDYFAYLEGTESNGRIIASLRHISERVSMLTETLMTKTAVSENRINISVTDLQSKDPWVKIRTTHRILNAFIKLMETTVRVVRYIGNNKQP
ncbi:interleukin-6 [Discoglossus pictus]